MIHSIQLRNFRRHESLNVEFPEGMTTITGPNSAGKTSLLKGILFALGGADAAGAKEHLWRRGSEGAKRSVELEITLPKYGRVKVERTPTAARVKAAKAQVEGNEVLDYLYASGQAPVTKFIEEAFGMPMRELLLLVVSPQGETQEIIQMGGAALQKKVESLAKVAVVDQALALMGTDVSRAEGEAAGLQAPEGYSVEMWENAVSGLTLLLNEATTRYEEIEPGALTSAAADKATRARELQEAQRVTREKEELTKKAEKLKGSMSVLSKQYDGMLGELSGKEDLDALAAAIHALYAEHEAAVVRKGQVEGQIRHAEQEVRTRQELCKQIEEAETELQSAEEVREALALTAAELQTTMTELSGVQALLVKMIREKRDTQSLLETSACPSCRRLYDDVTPEKKEAWRLQCDELAGKIKSAEAHEAELTATSRQRQGEQKVLWQREERLKRYQDVLTSATTRLSGIPKHSEEEIDDLKKTVEHWGRQVNELGTRYTQQCADWKVLEALTKRAEELTTELGQVTENYLQAQKVLEELPEADVTAAQERQVAAAVAYEQLYNDISERTNALSQAQKDHAHGVAMLEQAEEREAQRQVLLKKVSDLSQLQKHIRSNREKIAFDIWEGLLAYASALTASATSGVLTGLKRDGGKFSIRENDVEVPVEELGGAQRSIVGLSLRIALAYVFYGQGLTILLDEATADARDETAAAIAGMLSSIGSQVIAVSHREGDVVNSGEVVSLEV